MKTRDELMIEEVINEAFVTMAEDVRDAVTSLCERLLELERTNWQPPVDPDLIEAREIVAAYRKSESTKEGIRMGNWDTTEEVAYALNGLKRGRELERNGE